MIDTAILPIGGKGSRMKGESRLPKLLIKLNNYPLIYYSISYLSKQNIKNIIFISNNSSREVETYSINLCLKLNLRYKILHEKHLKGNFGGILENFMNLPENFLVVYPDILWTCDLSRIFEYHYLSQSQITLVVRRTDHPEDSDTVKLNPFFSVNSIYAKENKSLPKSTEAFDLCGATGIYVMNKSFLKLCDTKKKEVINKKVEIDLFQTIESLISNNNLQISAYLTNEFIKDCGTPKRFKLVEKVLRSKNIYNTSYKNKQKVLLIDRDGTLIKNASNNYIINPDEVQLNDAMISFYKEYTSKGFTPIVVTNQPQISFGILDFETLDKIHCRIQELLSKRDLITIFKFLICPHHPHTGFKNELNYFKFSCSCRKPNIGLFNELERFLIVDKKESIMFGDTKRDEEFASNCGVNFQLIK